MNAETPLGLFTLMALGVLMMLLAGQFGPCCAAQAAGAGDVGLQQTPGDELSGEAGARLDGLIDALVRGSHLRQVIVQEEGRAVPEGGEGTSTPAGTGDPALFSRGDLSLADVKRLGALSGKLAGEYRDETVLWVRGVRVESTAGDVAAAVAELDAVRLPDSPNLPYNLFQTYLLDETRGMYPRSVRAIANILQESVDIKSSGPEMPDLVLLYYALGLKVNFVQLGFPMDEPLAAYVGGMLAPRFGRIPDWQDFQSNTGFQIGRSIICAEVMGDKITGRRDYRVLAREVLDDPEIKALMPVFKSMSARRVALFGHSMSMSAHGSTLASWCNIAFEAMHQVNPGFEYKIWSKGGSMFQILSGDLPDIGDGNGKFDKAIEFKPNDVYLLIDGNWPPDRMAPVEKAAGQFDKIAAKMYAVDGVRPFVTPQFDAGALAKLGVTVVPLREKGCALRLLDQRWESYDGIHGCTFLHVFYAKEFLKWYAAREQQGRGPKGLY